MEELEGKLLKRGIKPTAVRLLVFREMLNFSRAFSLSDLEYELESVDKSTLFRTITLFHDHLLIHSIDDGSGSMKYSVCSDNCMCSIGDMHVHFNCTNCHKTFCIESIAVPSVQLPENFLLESVNFVMKGLCNRCSGGSK